MHNIIIESMYFPPVFVLQQMSQSQNVFIDVGGNYLKGSFRNKCIISTGNGHQLLTVPLKKGKNNQMPMSEVEISYDENWPKKHIAAIRTAYGKSPYFIHFIEDLEKLLFGRHQYISTLNSQSLDMLNRYMKLTLNIHNNEIYTSVFNGNDLRDQCLLSNYGTFEVKPYPQVFEDRYGFQNNLSSLDLLFCMGNYGREIVIS